MWTQGWDASTLESAVRAEAPHHPAWMICVGPLHRLAPGGHAQRAMDRDGFRIHCVDGDEQPLFRSRAARCVHRRHPSARDLPRRVPSGPAIRPALVLLSTVSPASLDAVRDALRELSAQVPLYLGAGGASQQLADDLDATCVDGDPVSVAIELVRSEHIAPRRQPGVAARRHRRTEPASPGVVSGRSCAIWAAVSASATNIRSR